MYTEARENLQVHLQAGAAGRVRPGDRQRKPRRCIHPARTVAKWLALLIWLACRGEAAQPTVIMLSWDGTRHDYPERAQTPALDRMEREGARASGLVPVFPSNTFPNHVSLATGAHVDRHGIVGNQFVDRASGKQYDYSEDASWIEAEPLWIAAERQGVRAATFFWAGSETEWRGRSAHYRKRFDDQVPESAKVDQILAWLDLPEPERPHLILSWWHGCDQVGHHLGPDAPQIAEQLAQQDAELGRLIAGLDARGAWRDTTLLVVSDHGMAAASEPIDPAARLRDAEIRAEMISGGGMAHIALEDPSRLADALAALGDLPHVRAYPSAELPAQLRARYPSRSGDITVLTEPPYVFRREPNGAGTPADPPRARPVSGVHGYDPERPEMAAIFYALGRGVAPGTRLGRPLTIDIAPTVAHLLHIDPPMQSEGRALPELRSSPSVP
jgi:predicted AlkP superfamily pyrophosphatase or phosphodiesterase